MRRSRRRGSICVYVAVVLLSLGMVAAALVPLSTSYGTRTARRADELRARLAFEAGVAQIKSQSLAMTLVVPSTLSTTINGTTGSLAVAANDTQLTNSLLVTGTIVLKGRSYRYSRVIGARLPQPYGFAVSTNNDLNFPKTITMGANGWGGDLFSNGKVTLGGAATGSAVNGGMISVKKSSYPSGTTVTGQVLQKVDGITWPTPSSTDYLNAANAQVLALNGAVVLTDATLTSVVFPTISLGTAYPMWYYAGNLTLSGTISGKGTIYVKGNLTINGNLRYATPSDEAAIVVQGDVNVSSSATTIDGYYFVNGNFNAPQSFTLTRGAIAAKSLGTPQTVSVTRDDAILLDTSEAVRARLPYYWP